MNIARPGHGPLDYDLVQYPGSPMRFRGPVADMTGAYVLCLGGAETFGKYIPTPYPLLLGAALDRPVVNMGAVNAGLDLLLNDAAIGAAMAGAGDIVLQVPGAANMTNRFYRVHPRRNDRVLRASSLLHTIYREVDFTEFHFTRHMLGALQLCSSERFAILLAELQEAWLGRMRQLLGRVTCPVHLLWLAPQGPADAPDGPAQGMGLGPDPLFVTDPMIAQIAAEVASFTVITPAPDTRDSPNAGKLFAPREEAAASAAPGPSLHTAAAAALVPHLSRA